MSSHPDEKKSTLTPAGCARRRFLKKTALATAAMSSATFLPAAVEASPTKCADVKAPMKEVDGKVAFITGGSSGIGLGIARAFVDAGMKVVLTYRTQAHIDEAMQYFEGAQDRVHTISVDVTDRQGMEKAATEAEQVFAKVHVLVNNAGVYVPAPLSNTTYDDWDFVMSVNLNGVFNGVHTFLPRIQAHGDGGQIITTSSILGLFVLGGLGGYSTSKFGVVGMMETLRAELAETNIGVSVYCPGVVGSSALKSNIVDANRNRPSNLANTGVKADPKALAEDRKGQNDPSVAMDTLEAGRLVLQGIRNNDLYILTHPEFEQEIRDRNEALIASIPRDVHPIETRVTMARSWAQESIYVTERERQLCARAARIKRRK